LRRQLLLELQADVLGDAKEHRAGIGKSRHVTRYNRRIAGVAQDELGRYEPRASNLPCSATA
jgi:hypothetical protein